MEFATLPSGEKVPALGQGTWKIEAGQPDEDEAIRALQTGIDLGLKLIDTAEMYGSGRSELLVGKAIAGRRDEASLVSKVLPSNASAAGTRAACERSLKALSTDRIDLYLLHWQGNHPLDETISAFERLKAEGKIRHWGVSNFDLDDMEELEALAGQGACASNQVMYGLAHRGIEWDLLGWCQKRSMPIMAYSPLGEGKLVQHPLLATIAAQHGVAPAAVALRFVLDRDNVIAIPKTARVSRVRENAAALALRLTTEDREALDRAFPPPRRKMQLAMV